MSDLKKFIPSELRLTQKWDYAIETFITKAFVGGLVASTASLVLFRKFPFDITLQDFVSRLSCISGSKNPRLAFSALGVGFGAGDAYRLSTIAFEQEKENQN